jgi:thioredoxin reductase (NADPH)
MQERAFANPKLNFLLDSVAVDIHGQDAVEQLQVRNLHSGQDEYLDVAGVFIAVGHDPRSELVADQIPLDAAGYVRTYGRTSMTEVAGVFACGDLVDHTYRQAVTAAGTGCAAALDVERYLAGIDEVSPSTATADPNLVA